MNNFSSETVTYSTPIMDLIGFISAICYLIAFILFSHALYTVLGKKLKLENQKKPIKKPILFFYALLIFIAPISIISLLTLMNDIFLSDIIAFILLVLWFFSPIWLAIYFKKNQQYEKLVNFKKIKKITIIVIILFLIPLTYETIEKTFSNKNENMWLGDISTQK